MNMTPWTLSADVLIVGGGFTGMWAAKKARDHVRDVLIVDKGPRDWGGLGSMCGGDMIARMPDDDLDAMLKELVYYYDGLVEQDLMEEILRQSSDRFRDYEALGHTFRKDAEGNYIPVPQRGLANMKSYLSVPPGSGGANLRRELTGEMKEKFPNVKIRVRVIRNDFFGERITVAGLLTGQDIIAQLKDEDLGDEILLPCNVLRMGEDVFLDDITLTELKRTLQVQADIVKSSGQDLLNAVLGRRQNE